MTKKIEPPTFRGKSLGITTLTAAQLLIGVIHIFSGALLFAFENFSALPATAAYDIYTLMYGLLILVFAVFFWQGKKAGWIGTVLVSIVRYCRRFFDCSRFAQCPRDPKGTSVCRDNI